MDKQHVHRHSGKAENIEEARDPVCGMRVNAATTKHHFDYGGERYTFCCSGCLEKFKENPQKYLSPREPEAVPDLHIAGLSCAVCDMPGAIYTCPMHPEVRQDHPGDCPLCGMALELLAPTAETGDNAELKDMTRRLWAALILAVPVVGFAMGGDVPGFGSVLARAVPPSLSNWLQFVFTTPAVLWAGSFFFTRAWRSVAHRSLNMFSLIALGTGTAYLYSVIATLFPELFPADFRGASGTVATYFESAAVITVLVIFGQVLELRARQHTGSAIRALLDLTPKATRRIKSDGTDEDIPLDQVAVGDRLRVRPGDAVPADGTVLEGHGAVDESMVTGEPMPILKSPGDKVIGGTVNGTAALVMRADVVGESTMLARIVAMVAEAQRSRAPIQRLADIVSGWFVPAVIGVAALAFVGWAIWGPAPALAYALIAAVSVLLIACPCALGLATPMSIQVAVGKGATVGVLIRSAEALERLEKIDTLVVDKTGTLTEGKPRLTAVIPAAGYTEDGLLQLAASLERASEHPLAAAISSAAGERNMALHAPSQFESITGKGVCGKIGDARIALGNAALMTTEGVNLDALSATADQARTSGATALFIAVQGQLAGVLTIADPIRPTTRAALDTLRREHVRIVMLTGDHRRTAEAIARQLGITEVNADIMPAQKYEIVRGLRNEGRVVAMAGDGVNDAPALTEADIGIAMGTGTDIAIQSAAITLVKGDLAGIARARALSRATMRNIRQNLFLAFVYNGIGVPIAAGVLYPVLGVLLSPMIAALAMSLSSVSVISNALRLRRLRLEGVARAV